MSRKPQSPEQLPARSAPRRGRPASPPDASLLDRDGLLDSGELATFLKLPVSTLDAWASKGGGPLFHKVGIHRRYDPADVKAWLAERRLAATGDPRPAA